MDIDVVISWVDGADPSHIAKRRPYIASSSTDTSAASVDSVSDFRFGQGGEEIRLCLSSIAKYAPWIRRIWVITDSQMPPLAPATIRNKVRVVDHRLIFAGHTNLLPTFNSVAIETMMWRIPGLADHFIYLNDDMGFCNPVSPTDFFSSDGASYSRGRWGSYPADQRGTWQTNQVRAASMLGFGRQKMFIDAHVGKALKKDTFVQLFREREAEFVKNASYRFRSPEQFLPVGLHEHTNLVNGSGALHKGNDWTAFSIANCRKDSWEVIEPKIKRLHSEASKLYCINDMSALFARMPGAAKQIRQVLE